MAKRTLADKIRTNRKRTTGTAERLALELRIDLAQIIFRILKVSGATKAELAKAARIPPSRLIRILNGDWNSTTEEMGAIAAALGVDFHLRADTAL